MIGFKTFVLWLHLLAVVVWIGGLFFLLFVLLLAFRKTEPAAGTAAFIIRSVGARFQIIAWEMIAVITLTGLFNLFNTGYLRNFNFGDAFLQTVSLKIGLFVGLVILHGLLSYRLLPGMMKIAREMSSTAAVWPDEMKQLYKRVVILATIFLVMSSAVIYLGLRLGTV